MVILVKWWPFWFQAKIPIAATFVADNEERDTKASHDAQRGTKATRGLL